MASKLISLLVVAAVAFGTICYSAPIEVYGNDNWVQNKAVHELLRSIIPGKDISLHLDSETAMKYLDLAACYNGSISQLQRDCDSKKSDITEEPLHQLCDEHREQLLDSYMVGLGYLTGSSIILPVHFLRQYEQFVSEQKLDESEVEKNLVLFSGTWEFEYRFWEHNDYCKRMINLVDTELARWGYTSQQVTEYFNSKMMMPVGNALELCRKRSEL